MLVVRVLVEMYVNGRLLLLLLDFHVVPRCKGVDVHNGPVGEDLVVDQRGEFLKT